MQASRSVLLRDFFIFQLKLWADGFKDLVMIQLSLVAVVVDLFFGGTRKRLFYKVIKLGERIDLWLNLHGALSRGDGTGDGLFGGSRAGAKTMLGQLEQAVRGGDEPRRGKRRRQS
ncbi:MAG: hypothetical protein ABIF09_05300 [Gemmatimonadota bacterium]